MSGESPIPGAAGATRREPAMVNDVHSGLNETRVAEIARPRTLDDVRRVVRAAAGSGRPIAVCGGRHSMGGQQFATDALLVDMRGLDWIGPLNSERGLVEVGAGIQWPALIDGLDSAQQASSSAWTIAQKQTGADRLTIGGALSANVHGRGLRMGPFVNDVESFVMVDAKGGLHSYSRGKNAELFALAIGGYGLFGIVVSVTLRLARRRKLERIVRVMDIADLMPAFDSRIADGYLYGDFQFAIANDSDDFLRRGIFSCYRPVDEAGDIPTGQHALSEGDWRRLITLAHTDKKKCWDLYSAHYLGTEGQQYWSDLHQMSTYLDDYHRELDEKLKSCRGSEMITEIYVPRERLTDFMDAAAGEFRRESVNCIYGTIRLIERDSRSFLNWARESWACIIFNIHADHDAESLHKSADVFRKLIDFAIERGGCYYLTYHRYATREQVLATYPQFPEFLRQKLRYDPDERFQSDWYRHYRAMFAADLGGAL